MNLPLKIVAGVLIPSLATIIFNVLNFLVDNLHTSPFPPVSESVFDVSVGCTFALLGVGITSRSRNIGERYTIVSVLLILAIIAVEILAPVFLHWQKAVAIFTMDALSMLALSWGIADVG